MNKPLRKLVAVGGVAALAGVIVVSALAASASPTRASKVQAGGVYRVGWESSFGFTNGLDPTGEYLGDAIGLLNNLLVRTLVGTNHLAGAAGNQPVADLATALPAPTNGGKTYTFHLKSGIKFGPPVSRPITSKDFVTTFQRIANPKNGAQYGFYYNAIKGMTAFGAGKAKSISGISTPNASTIVFNLTKPTGDFLFRLAMPAAAPLPAEVTKCFDGQPGKYGRNLVSSGPYMIAGSDKVNASSCSAIKPASGFDGQTKLGLVRNPDYAASSDSKAARENLPDEFVFTVDSNADDIYNKVKAGELDDEVAGETPKVLRDYTTDSSLKKYLHQNSGDRTWYITLNLTQAPFDDVHIRKAANWILDKDAMRKVWGGATAGAIAHHIVPDTLFNFAKEMTEFDPYGTPGEKGSVAKAKAEVKKSAYDSNHDGVCDAKACSGVLMISDTRGVDPGMVAVLQSNFKEIGITFTVRQVNGAYPTIQTPRKNVPIAERPGWGKDYPDPLTFFEPLFDGRNIIPTGNTNYSLVGITPAMAKKVGVTGNLKNVPSVNADIDKCAVQGGDARRICYENLDKKLMTDVVPWIPWLWSYYTHVTGPKVTKMEFDQFATTPAYAHVAVSS